MKKVLFLILGVLLLTGCGNKKDEVIIYTSTDEIRYKALLEKIEEKFPDKEIIVQYMATGNLAAKIKNEGENIEADIILDLETAHMAALENKFADLSEFDTSLYLDGVNISDKYYTWIKYTMNVVVDNKYLKKHNLDAPKTYEDLLKPEYKNLISMPDPKTSGTGYAFFLNAVNVMGEEQAVAYFKKLKNNIREFPTSGSGATNLLKQGEIAIALGMTEQGVVAINEGYDFSVIELETGSPYNTTSLSIIKGKENKESVKEVFNWLLTDFNIYDKNNYMPDIILKGQKSNVPNYPTNLKDADMTGIFDQATKEHLTQLWGKVNG